MTSGSGLQAGLKNRHLTMIAIGGVIGAGLFVGSSSGIATAGPGILLSYALVGTLVVLVMRMLGEMSAANPTSGSFSAHADRALGRWAGFSIGWLYWFFWVVVLAVEATAGAKILEGWIPAVPQWGWALIVMVVLTATNLVSVGSYGEFEFWFAGIKVVAIGAFIVVGALAIFGVLPAPTPTRRASATSPTTAASCRTDPARSSPASCSSSSRSWAARSPRWPPASPRTRSAPSPSRPTASSGASASSISARSSSSSACSPWNDPSIKAQGSYVAALDSLGIAHAGQIMNFIVLTSVLSCLNSGLYTASRMAFSLGGRGDAPKAFARTTARGVPMAAIIASVVFGFVAVFFNYAYPDTVFLFLVNSSGAVALFVWLVICASQLRMRRIIERESPEKLVVRMWLYPYLTWATIALIVFVLGYMLTDTEGESSGRTTVLLSLLVALAVIAVSVVKERVRGGRATAVADTDTDTDKVSVG